MFVGWQELTVPQAPDSFPTAFRSERRRRPGRRRNRRHGFRQPAPRERSCAVRRNGRDWSSSPSWASPSRSPAVSEPFGAAWQRLLALAAAYAAAVAASFVLWNVWLPIAVPLLFVLPLAVLAGQVVHYLGAARWLGVYAPRQVSRQLLQGHELEASRPRRLEVTVMITDIVDFTPLAERSTPEAVTEFVNRTLHPAQPLRRGRGRDRRAVHRRQHDRILGRARPAARPCRPSLPGGAGHRRGDRGRERAAGRAATDPPAHRHQHGAGDGRQCRGARAAAITVSSATP